jgi:hypothetical protein
MNVTRVVLAGHTGTEKESVTKNLKEFLPEVRSDFANRIAVENLEDCIKRTAGGNVGLFAGVRNSRVQRDRWLAGWRLANKKLEESGAACQILSLHLSFAERGNRCCPVDLEALARWKPNIILTLIDDIYSVKRRIQAKRYTFSLAQLYDWRITEQMLADQVGILAGSLSEELKKEGSPHVHCESLVLAVKTPILSVARLIGRIDHVRAYASYPITSTRGSVELKSEVNSFRKRLHETMPTFDPLTIEELPLLNFTPSDGAIDYDVSKGPASKPGDEASKRWDCRIGNGILAPLVWEPDQIREATGKTEPFFPVRIEASEMEELSLPEQGEGYTTIHDHVEIRDIRLVAQADIVVCYRPYMDGSISGGVNTEIENANMLNKDVIAFIGKDKRKGKTLRGHINHSFPDEGEFWGYLGELAAKPMRLPRAPYY